MAPKVEITDKKTPGIDGAGEPKMFKVFNHIVEQTREITLGEVDQEIAEIDRKLPELQARRDALVLVREEIMKDPEGGIAPEEVKEPKVK